jgi:long-chain acyl-CoA synthetase
VTTLAPTLPGRLEGLARSQPDRIAFREKRLGLWREIRWAEYRDQVRAVARMLWELGVRPGDHVAILSDNRPEWLYADLGAQAIGARSVGIYQTNPPQDVAYILQDSGSVVLFCEDQEQVDKAVEIAAATPTVRQVIVFDPRGTRDLDDARLLRWEELLARGHELAAADPAWFDERLAALDPAAPAMVVYTSGTTGNPKGAMIASRNVLTGSEQVVDLMELTPDDTVLSYLPLCHVAEKIFSLFLPLQSGCIVHFGEAIETVQADLREVSPTVFLGVPRIWEKMHAGVTMKMQNSSWLKRHLFNFFTRRGQEISRRRRTGRQSAWDRLVWLLGHLLVFRPLRDRLGLGRCRVPISGAAPISPELLEWFHGIGVPIYEGYGQTEGTGVSHTNLPGAFRIGTVGRPLPQIECRLSEEGEVLVRGPSVFAGYLNRPEATAETVDPDGWLHTGDLGQIDSDGYLTITGRAKEIIITSGGKNLSPEKIENALKSSPYIKEAVAVGDGKNFVSALIQIDADSAGEWAGAHGITYTAYSDLAGRPELNKLIAGEVDHANQQLARVEAVRAFCLLPRELNQDDGELTATQKVRRKVVLAAHADLIDSMYRGKGGPR